VIGRVRARLAWMKHITDDRGTDVLTSLTCDDIHV
jgi:hypothetical protein